MTLKRDFNLLNFRCGTGLIQDIFTRASYPQFEEQLYLTSYIDTIYAPSQQGSHGDLEGSHDDLQHRASLENLPSIVKI